MSYFGISFKDNKEQQELIRLIQENDKMIIFCTGKAGTGKTFATLTAALDLQSDKKYRKIIYARNPVQLGESMGYLPGDISDKYDPFMGGLFDNLDAISRISSFNPSLGDLKHKVELVPIAFLRGRSFDDTILIVDEAQNLDLTALKTILTRMGKFSKVILLGSMNQIDDPKQARKIKCDFEQVINKLEGLPYVANIELTQSMRSPVCVEIDELLGEIK